MRLLAKIDMPAVTRLVRAGRLGEAMVVLRGRHLDPRPQGEAGPRPGSDLLPGPGSAPGRNGTARAAAPERVRPLYRSFGGIPGFDGLVGPAPDPVLVDVPDKARFEERAWADAAGRRTYKLYVPSRYDGRAMPLVVMLHGCTQSPDDFALGTRMNVVAEEQGFLVAYPAQSASANASKCWNWFNTGDQRRDRGEPSLIAGITRQIQRDFAVAPGRIYVAGLSAGGAAAAIMGQQYPDLYAAIGVHSGLACGAASDMASAFGAMRHGGRAATGSGTQSSAVPTIVFHGDGDATVNPINGDRVVAQSKAGIELRTTVEQGVAPGGIRFTRTIEVDRSGRTLVEHWILHGAGHAWSGGSPAGSYTEPRGPDASREMIRFFLRQPATAGLGG
jgi:poly(hydroxyalkanoate) depolymerase family esterase